MAKISRRTFLAAGGMMAGAAILPGGLEAAAMGKKNERVPLSAKSGPVLRFRPDGKFKILQLTDTHYIASKPELSNPMLDDIRNYIRIERPDLIIHTGDTIYTDMNMEAFETLMKPIFESGIPFAVTWGNHDHADGPDGMQFRADMQKRVEREPTNEGFPVPGLPGFSNFALPVLPSAGGSKPAAMIYGFDSLDTAADSYQYEPQFSAERPEIPGSAWITRDQIHWYEAVSEQTTRENGGVPVPSYSFFHIPFPEFSEAYTYRWTRIIGEHYESSGRPQINSGLYLSMLDHKDMVGVFCGHDHDINMIMDYKHSIKLVYGQVSGRSGAYCHLPEGYGCRIIELTEGEREFDTWIRLASGDVEYKVNSGKMVSDTHSGR